MINRGPGISAVEPLSETAHWVTAYPEFQAAMLAAKRLLEPFIAARESAALMLFGLPGSGQTLLAMALGRWINESLGVRPGIYVNCDIAAIVPHITTGKAGRIVEPWRVNLEAFDLLKDGGVLVIDNIDSLSGERRSLTMDVITARLHEMLGARGAAVVVVGTSRDPAKLDNALLAHFGMRLYVRPPDLEEISSLLEACGMEKSVADSVSRDINIWATPLDIGYVAPDTLLIGSKADLLNVSGWNVPHEVVAQRLCSGIPDLFIGSRRKLEYEQDNADFIRQSSLLEGLR